MKIYGVYDGVMRVLIFLLFFSCSNQVQHNIYWDRGYNSDKETISKSWDNVSSAYHYAWLETSIMNHLVFKPKKVLDVGTGYGHWIEFYRSVYSSNVKSIDISQKVVDDINKRYGNCKLADIINYKTGKYDVINAIGILHHVMNDKDLKKAIDNCYSMLKRNGILFIGTRFDWPQEKHIPKEKVRKFRTKEKWLKLLKDFDVRIDRSNPAKHIKKHLDLIICKKL